MKSKIFQAAAGGVLATVVVTLIVVFMLATSAGAANKYKVLYKFTGGADGDVACSDVIFDNAGNLYGTTYYGGDYGFGTVYKLTPNSDGSWTESVLHSFAGGNDGANPCAGLTLDAVGNLYGTTNYGGGGACTAGSGGCGAVFELLPNPDGSWTEKVLYSFTGGSDGRWLAGGLSLDGAGDLYGFTAWGGAHDSGTVFELTPQPDGSWTQKVIHSFTGKDGTFPNKSRPIFDSEGNLYAVTLWGGKYDLGVAFKLIPNPDGSWIEKVLHHFSSADGGWPEGTLVLDAVGNLYGVTWLDGAYGYGTVYRLKPGSGGGWSYRVLHHFTGGKDGANSYAGLIFDASGNLYGTTQIGGAYGYGTVFRLTPKPGGKWTQRVVHAFAAHPAAYPGAAVVFDNAGNLYSTTAHIDEAGDNHGAAVVFEITP